MKTIRADEKGFFEMGGWKVMLEINNSESDEEELDPDDDDFENGDAFEGDAGDEEDVISIFFSSKSCSSSLTPNNIVIGNRFW